MFSKPGITTINKIKIVKNFKQSNIMDVYIFIFLNNRHNKI